MDAVGIIGRISSFQEEALHQDKHWGNKLPGGGGIIGGWGEAGSSHKL